MARKPIDPDLIAPTKKMTERSKELAEARAQTVTPMMIAFTNAFFDARFDIALAADKSGVPFKQARSWVEDEGPCKDYISRRLESVCHQSDISLQEVVGLLIKEATREAADTKDKTVSHAARVSALNTLAKIKGGFTKGTGDGKKVQVNINIGGNAPVTIDGKTGEVV